MDVILPFILIILIPVFMIVMVYRLLAWVTTRRSTRHGIEIEEKEVKRDRVFRDG